MATTKASFHLGHALLIVVLSVLTMIVVLQFAIQNPRWLCVAADSGSGPRPFRCLVIEIRSYDDINGRHGGPDAR